MAASKISILRQEILAVLVCGQVAILTEAPSQSPNDGNEGIGKIPFGNWT